MPNAQHLAVLKQGAAVWNHWRASNPGACPDLSEADLSGVDLAGADLRGADLHDATFVDCRLTESNAGVPLNAQGKPGRAVPDVAANADPASGYPIRVDGQDLVIGGTSSAAPLWAGLIALLNQGLGHNLGNVNPLLYTQLGPHGVLNSGPRWNACTGWGSPDGKKLLAALSSLSK